MKFSEEVMNSIKMIKSGGFSIADIIFEGAISVKKKEVLQKIQELEDGGEAVGVIRIGYYVDNQVRVIEVPVGQTQQGAAETAQAEQMQQIKGNK